MSLDQKVIFSFPNALPDDFPERIRAIPGVALTKRGQVMSPINAVEVVKRDLLMMGVQARMSQPKTLWGDAVTKIGRAIQRGELRQEIDGIPFLNKWLKVFQQEAITFLLQRGSGLIWASPGSGKTAMAIVAALCEEGNVVVVTKGGARFQWAGEVRRFTHLEPHTWKPESARRKKDELPEDYAARMKKEGKRAFIVIGWEMLSEIRDQLEHLFSPSIVVFDESHRGKAPKRKKWFEDEEGQLQSHDLENMSSAAYKLAKSARHRFATTGTPIMNRLSDLWGQLSLVEPESWGITASKFLFRYCGARPGEYGGIIADGFTNADELKYRMGFAVHQVPYQVSHAQLPEKRRRVSVVPLDQQVKPMGFGALTKEMKSLGKAIAHAESEGSSTVRAILDRMTEIRIMEACAKKRKAVVDRVVEVIGGDAEKRKVTVFSGRKEDVEAIAHEIEKTLLKMKIGCPVYIGHGDVSAEDREIIRNQYMDGKVAVLVGTYQSFGESLNLHDTDYVCVAMLPYRPGEVEQLEGRFHRLGMDRPFLIEYLIAERSVDERVKHLLLDKLPAVDKLSGGQSALGGLSDTLGGSEGRAERMQKALAFWTDDMDDTELDE